MAIKHPTACSRPCNDDAQRHRFVFVVHHFALASQNTDQDALQRPITRTSRAKSCRHLQKRMETTGIRKSYDSHIIFLANRVVDPDTIVSAMENRWDACLGRHQQTNIGLSILVFALVLHVDGYLRDELSTVVERHAGSHKERRQRGGHAQYFRWK